MPRHPFGGTMASVVTDRHGEVVSDWPIDVFDAPNGTRLTDLREIDGVTPIAQLRSNAATSPAPGAIRTFLGPLDVTTIYYRAVNSLGQVAWYKEVSA